MQMHANSTSNPTTCQPFEQFLASLSHPLATPLVWDAKQFTYITCPKGRAGNKDARYRAWSVGVAGGYFHCWHCDIKRNWSAVRRSVATPEQRLARDRATVARALEDALRADKARLEANALWGSGAPCVSHPYLTKKQITGIDVRCKDDTLLIPIYDERGALVNLEKIYFDGERFQKRRVTGALATGVFGLVGSCTPSTAIIYLAEGYATAMTVHEATGLPVAMSFGCSNLGGAARAIRVLYPASRIVVVADKNDNGIGERSAKAVGEYRLCPADGDFNDWFCELLEKGFSRAEALAQVSSFIKEEKEKVMLRDFEYPNMSNKGRVLCTTDNLEALLLKLEIVVRFNEMKWAIEVDYSGKDYTLDAQNRDINFIDDLCVLHDMPTGKLLAQLNEIAHRNSYHPIVDCIRDNPWDGVFRVEGFIKTLCVEKEHEDLRDLLVLRWLLSAVKAAHSKEGFACQGVLVLMGAQYKGKTTWFSKLDPCNSGAVQTSVVLDPTSKDDILRVNKFWINELGEVDSTFRRSDIARLKGFITNQFDEVRSPYAAKSTLIPRRSVFGATVNSDIYLIDKTGNRRWWTIPIIEIENHNLDMEQVWAEIYHYLTVKEMSPYLSQEELAMLNAHNTQFEQIDEIEDALRETFDFENYYIRRIAHERKTASEILKIIQPLLSGSVKSSATNVGITVTRLLGEKSKKSNGRLVFNLPIRK